MAGPPTSAAGEAASHDARALAPAASRWRTWTEALFAPEPAVALALFRIAWGSLMAWESWRYLVHGWIHLYYVQPTFLFKYVGFEWVHALGPKGMTAVTVAMIVSGVMVALGLFYRAASAVFFATHTYEFLLGAANYLNHAYLITLLAGLMILVPAHRTLSIDAVLRPRIASAVTPAWPRALFRAQLGIVYVYGAFAKLNTDWLVFHQPVRRWMQGSADRVVKTPWLRAVDVAWTWTSPGSKPLTTWLHDAVASEGFTVFIAYGGVLFDLLVVPALLWRRTRIAAVVAAICFHVANMHLFSIGVFPWLMLAATTLFFEPDWPLRIPKLGGWIGHVQSWIASRGRGVSTRPRCANLWATLWGTWLLVQVLIPLRHHLYPGDVAWTEEGHYCSWRMKLRSKKGTVLFRVVDRATGDEWTVDPADELTKRQARKMRGRPELIRQYAVHLARRTREREGREVAVYVDAFTSLNYRARQRHIDPEHDLGGTSASWAAYPWILPMKPSDPPGLRHHSASSSDAHPHRLPNGGS